MRRKNLSKRCWGVAPHGKKCVCAKWLSQVAAQQKDLWFANIITKSLSQARDSRQPDTTTLSIACISSTFWKKCPADVGRDGWRLRSLVVVVVVAA